MDEQIVKKEKSHKTRTIILMSLVAALCFALFIFIMFLIGKNKREQQDKLDPESGDHLNKEFCYNQLLKTLNDGLKETRVDDNESLADYISGYNDSKIYSYDVNLTSVSEVKDLKTAFEYVVDNGIDNQFTYNFVRYNPVSSSEFTAKYGENGKYKIGNILETNKVFATMNSEDGIKVINNIDLSTTLNNEYSPLTFKKGDYLFEMYSFIISK